MELKAICLGCMEDKGEQKVCPKCGWAEGTEPESPLHLKPRTVLSGKYMLGKVLGHGGFGITYLARDLNLGTKLAVKEYFPQGMATRSTGDATISVYSGGTKEHFEYGLEKFIEEARTLAKFDDISEVVAVKDFFKENGTAYLVMSYVEGVTLKEYLTQNGGRLPLDAVLNVMLPIMKALEHVHKAGILHRDISPDNVYVTRNFNVKLLDFGAARFAMGEYSKSLSVLLKPGYAPEEQYRTKGKQGPWTDVYAVAATMYRALTGETPPEALDRMHEDTLVPPSSKGVEIPGGMEAALMKALNVSAAQRFQDIREFREVLLGNAPVAAVKPVAAPENNKVIEAPDTGSTRQQGQKSLWIAVGAVALAACIALVVWIGGNKGEREEHANGIMPVSEASTTTQDREAENAVATALAEKTENPVIIDTPVPVIDINSRIRDVMTRYEQAMPMAVSSNDFSMVQDTLIPGSSLYTMQRNLVDTLYKQDIKERLVEFSIEEIREGSSTGEYKVYTYERIDIKYPKNDDYVTKEFRYIYTVICTEDQTGLSNIEKWN